MAFTKSTAPHIDAQIDAAFHQAESGLAEGKTVVLFVPSPDIEAYVKRYAVSHRYQTLGVTVTTISSWAQDMWELVGDNRRMVSALQRTYYMKIAVNNSRGGFSKGAGSVSLLEKLAASYLPMFTSLTTQRMQDAHLTKAETFLCLALTSYQALLKRNELIELGDILSQLPVFPKMFFVYLEGFDTPFHHERFLARQGSGASVRLISCGCTEGPRYPAQHDVLARILKQLPCTGNPRQSAIQPEEAIRVLLPSGDYAAPLLVYETIMRTVGNASPELCDDARAALLCSDVLAWYQALAPRLTEEGMSVEARLSVPLTDSRLASLVIQVADICYQDSIHPSTISDVLFSLGTVVPIEAIQAFDTFARAHRVIDKDEVIDRLSRMNDAFDCIFSAANSGDYVQVVEIGYDLLKPAVASSYEEALLQASFNTLSSFFSFWSPADLPWVGAKELLAGKSLRIHVGLHGSVVLMPFMDAPSLSPASFDSVILCDGTSKAYSSRTPQDASSLILEKLGIADSKSRLDQQRFALFFAVQAARTQLVFERPLCDAEGESTTNATVFDELLDCFVNDPTDENEYAKSGIPRALNVAEQGEECITINCINAAFDGKSEIAQTLPFALEESLKPYVISVKDYDGEQRLLLSASAIEAYLDCPYKWFLERRLRLDTPDAEFGPIERGSFVHDVLKEFFTSAKRDPAYERIRPSNVSAGVKMLDAIFNEKLAIQRTLPLRSNPYIPREPLELQQVENLRYQLTSFVERQAGFLPGFKPVRFELSFGKDNPITYADAFLQGSIDRIDSDDQGNIVIIDYKGSLSDDYNISSSVFEQLPEHVQTLLYARITQMLLPECNVVGALYVSYGTKEDVRGVVDGQILTKAGVGMHSGHRKGIVSVEDCGATSFDELLDCVESSVRAKLKSLASGEIQPSPQSKNTCKYCLKKQCPARDGYESREA